MHDRPISVIDRHFGLLALLAAVAIALVGTPASAQECPCDCYFSGDCEPGNFCNWGSLPQEDSCFWRTPKPQGNPGAGCEEEYGNWGQCDGICTPTTALSLYSMEKIEHLVRGIVVWSNAMTSASMAGGGHPVGHLVARGAEIEYQEPRMHDGMWRIAVEVLTLTRGPDYVTYPDAVDVFHSEQVAVKDLRDDRELVTLGNAAVQALVAEIRSPGAGWPILARLAEDGLDGRLDATLLERVCRGDATTLECLYGRLRDIGEALGRGGRGDAFDYGTGPSCTDEESCLGDIDGNGVIDVDDLVSLLLRYGHSVPPEHPADPDGNGVIDVDDLVILLTNWGPCAP